MAIDKKPTPSENKTEAPVAPKITFECPVHGNIEQAVLQLSVFNKFNHFFCMECFDSFLQKSGVPLVKISK
jgi:hypothetical protein